MEVEARVKVDDLEALKEKLSSMGAEFFPVKSQRDTIFKKKGEEFKPQGPGDFLLRVRESTKNMLTFKALTDRAGVWVEHQTEVQNPEETKTMLEKAGFSKALSLSKKRLPGKLDDFELCLDDIKEMGTYIEIALDSNDGNSAKIEIVKLLNKLGYKESQIIHKGYVAMLFEKLGVKFKGTG